MAIVGEGAPTEEDYWIQENYFVILKPRNLRREMSSDTARSDRSLDLSLETHRRLILEGHHLNLKQLGDLLA